MNAGFIDRWRTFCDSLDMRVSYVLTSLVLKGQMLDTSIEAPAQESF